MWYEIDIQDGEINNLDDKKIILQPKLFKYRFYSELFNILKNYKVRHIDINELYIIIGTTKNELLILNNNKLFNKVGLYKFTDEDIIFHQLEFNEINNTLHIINNNNVYKIYEIILMINKIDLKIIYTQTDVLKIFLNKIENKCLIISKTGDCKLIDIKSKNQQILISNRAITENNKINVIWSNNQKLLFWNIEFYTYLYDYEINKMLLKINLKNELINNERIDINKIKLYYYKDNIYIITKNRVYLCTLFNSYENKHEFNINLIYKLDSIYSIIDISNIKSTELNMDYICITSILDNSKDQLNIFIFDDFFRIIKHDVIHCKKYILNDFKTNNYIKDNYINLQLLQNIPKFLKLNNNQLLIHKNNNTSFLIMECNNDDEMYQFYIKNNLIENTLFSLNNINKQTEIYLIITFLKHNSNFSIKIIDRILYNHSRIENAQEEFNIYLNLFKYYNKFDEFIYFINESLHFIELFNKINNNGWYLEFLIMLFNENIELFYYLICESSTQKIIKNICLDKNFYHDFLSNIKKINENLDIFNNCKCNSIEYSELKQFNIKEKVYYYLSYIELLSWYKTSFSETLKYFLHLLSEFSNNKMIEKKIINYFEFNNNYSNKSNKFVIENLNCILRTNNYYIITSLMFEKVENDINLYYNLIKNNNYILFLFIQNLTKYYQNYINKNIIPNKKLKNNSNEISNFLNSNIMNIIELYLTYSKHFLLEYLIKNYKSINFNELLKKIDLYLKNEFKDIDEYNFIIEAKCITLFLLNNKTIAITKLLNFELIYSCLSLILYFDSENEEIWNNFFDIIFQKNREYQKQIEELLYWFEFFLYNPLEEIDIENNSLEIISNFTFPKDQYYYNILKVNKKKYLINCCNWHNIPLNLKYINQNVKNILTKKVNLLKESIDKNLLDEYLFLYRNLHEKYLKLQLHLSCSSYDYYNEEASKKNSEYINNISKAIIINNNDAICSLCNSKLIYFKNDKLSNKVITNYCNHNYHYECFIQNIHLNQKSRKFKVNIENNICKSNMKCIICQYKRSIDK